MELSPQSVAQTTFKTVKKGYDPTEVRAYLARLATAIESTQTQAAAMEARARAAVARLQELAAQPAQQQAPVQPAAAESLTVAVAPAAERDATVDEAQTISRTLLLAQRTADTTIAEANAEAKKIKEEAESVAQRALDNAKEVEARLIEEAKIEARRASEDQRVQIDSEVQSLLARREFLLSDVEHLEAHVVSHRERLRGVAESLTAIADRTEDGLADLRRPLTSAVEDDAQLDDTMAIQQVPTLGAIPSATGDSPSAASPASDGSESADAGAADGDAAGTAAPSAPTDVDADNRPPGDLTPAAGTPIPADVQNTQVIPTVPGPRNDVFSVSGEELR